MTLRPIDSTGDILPVLSLSDLSTGLTARAALLLQHLHLNKGEWWEYAHAGNPILDELQSIRPTENELARLADILTDYMLTCPGVLSVSHMTLTPAATPGTDAETDAQARYRRSLAVSAPSVSPYEALLNSLLTIPGLRACKLYVNDTDSTDSNGIPAHAICAVMAGGNTTRIAQTLFAKKAPGVGTHGATSATVTDSFGFTHTLKFQRATETATAISVTLTALTGFDTGSDPDKLKDAIVTALSAQGIAQPLVVPSLYAACYGAVTSPCFTITSVTASPAGGSASSGTISAAWNQRYVTYSNMVTITVN